MLQRSLDTAYDEGKLWGEVMFFEHALTELFDECLALTEGAAIRGREDIGAFCSMADAVADDILTNIDLEWGAFTVPATSEFYSRSSRVIRVRYPSMSVWDLPTVAHELGHFVGPALTAYQGGEVIRPYQSLVDQAERREGGEALQLSEIFADMFAAYVCGPAYLSTSVYLRLSPVDGPRPYSPYPSPTGRILAITSVLEAVSEPGMEKVTADAQAAWRRAQAVVGPQGDECQSNESAAPSWQGAILDLLENHLPFARFSDWQRAKTCSAMLKDERMSRELKSAGFRAIHVLNAAWLARLENPDLLATIEYGAQTSLSAAAG